MAVYDFAVIGGGIAGASAACELAERGRVLLVEQEDQPGYHSTGRSAAMLIVNYGSPEIVALTRLSEPFLRAPPSGFTDQPLLKDCGCLVVGEVGEDAALDAAEQEAAGRGAPVQRLIPDQVAGIVPAMRTSAICGGLWDPGSASIDVNALHTGFLRSFRRRGGDLRLSARAERFARRGGAWAFQANGESIEAATVVNAAGGWAQDVGAAMGSEVRGVIPHRRTAALATLAGDVDVRRWPLVLHVDEQYYFKGDAGRLLLSPADQTPVPPGDAQADDYDVAVAVERIERIVDVSVRRITHRWAGLRTFAPDHRLVLGFDPDVEGLFWLAGQGGAGIMTSPALSRAAAALAAAETPPAEISEAFAFDAVSPTRLRQR